MAEMTCTICEEQINGQEFGPHDAPWCGRCYLDSETTTIASKLERIDSEIFDKEEALTEQGEIIQGLEDEISDCEDEITEIQDDIEKLQKERAALISEPHHYKCTNTLDMELV